MAIYAWGRTDAGAIPGVRPPNARSTASETPQALAGLDGVPVTAMAAGDSHSVFVSSHGDVYTVGRGAEGQLGRTGDARTVGRVSGELEGARVSRVAAGAGFTLAVTEDGRLFEWGLVFEDANGVHAGAGAARAKGSAAFAKWSMAGVRDGAAPTPEELEAMPEKAAFSDPSLPAQGATAAKLAAARKGMDPLEVARAAGIDEERAWQIAGTVLPGMAESLSHMDDRKRRVVIRSALRYLASTQADPAPEGEDAAAARRRARAFDPRILSSDILRMKLDRVPVPAPRHVSFLSGLGVRVREVAAGHAHVVAIDDQGRAFSAGFNDRGQLALGHRVSVPTFQRIIGGLAAPDAGSVDRAQALADAAARDGGDGGPSSAPGCSPETGFSGAVALRPGLGSELVQCAAPRFASAACGQAHTLLLDVEGRAWAAGSGGLGQLGNNSGGDRPLPTLVTAVPMTHPLHVDEAEVAATRALREEAGAAADAAAGRPGTRMALLDREEAALAHATSSRRPARIVAVACGNHHSLLLTEDETLWGMGHAEYGQLALHGGDGEGDLAMPPRYFYRPRLVGASLHDVLSSPLHARRILEVSAGSQFSAARDADGGIVVFGWGSYGVTASGSDDSGAAAQLPDAIAGLAREREGAATGREGARNAAAGVGAFGRARPALHVVCGRDHVLCACVPDGNPAAKPWGGLLTATEADGRDGSGTPGGASAKDASDEEEATLSRWSDRGDAARAASAVADVIFVPLTAVARPVAAAAPRAGSSSMAGPSAASAASAPTAGQLRAERDAASLHVDRGAVMARLEGLLGGLAKKVAGAAPAAPHDADEVELPGGQAGRVWRAAFKAHWPILAARWPAIRGCRARAQAAADGCAVIDSEGARVVVATASSALGRRLASAAKVEPPAGGLVVAVVGVHPLTAVDAVGYAYQDTLATPRHRARQLAGLAAALGADDLAARASLRGADAPMPPPSSGAAARSAGGAPTMTSWASDMEALLASGEEEGEVTIEADPMEDGSPGTVRVHTVSLLRSDFFRVALAGGFSEAAAGASLPLPGIAAGTLRLVLDWLHKGDPSIIDGETALPLLAASRRLCIDDLVREVQAAVEDSMDEASAPAVLAAGEALDLPRLIEAARRCMGRAAAADAAAAAASVSAAWAAEA